MLTNSIVDDLGDDFRAVGQEGDSRDGFLAADQHPGPVEPAGRRAQGHVDDGVGVAEGGPTAAVCGDADHLKPHAEKAV